MPKPLASQRRWFVPIGLFLPMCSKVLVLKRELAASSKIVLDLQTLELNYDDSWCNITTLFYTGRFGATLALLKRTYGDNICDDPLSVYQNIPAGQDLYETRDLIAQTLYLCSQYRAALMLYEQIADTKSEDVWSRIANCYRELGHRRKAIDILETLDGRTSLYYFTLGKVYSSVKEYEKSEHSYLLALELSCSRILSEKVYDKYGHQILTDTPQEANVNLIDASSHDERLSRIKDISPDVIACVGSLGWLYSYQKQYLLGNKYCKTALRLTSELYGSGAATQPVSDTHAIIATNYQNLGEFTAAIDHSEQSLSVYRKLSKGPGDVWHAFKLSEIGHGLARIGRCNESMDCFERSLNILEMSTDADQYKVKAHTLQNLGQILMASERLSDAKPYFIEALAFFRKLALDIDGDGNMAFNLLSLSQIYVSEKRFSEAEEHCNQALAMYRQLSQGRESFDTALSLHELGHIHMNMRLYIDAVDNYKHSIAIHIALENCESNFEIASALSNLGVNYTCMEHYKKAEYYNEQALAAFRGLSQGAPNIHIAETLLRLGFNYHTEGVNTTKAIGRYREAVHMYLRVDPQSLVIGYIWDRLSLDLNHHHRV